MLLGFDIGGTKCSVTLGTDKESDAIDIAEKRSCQLIKVHLK